MSKRRVLCCKHCDYFVEHVIAAAPAGIRHTYEDIVSQDGRKDLVMSRRGQNEGSIYRRKDGRWVGSLNVGVTDGKRRRKDFYGKTRREVQEQLTAALRCQQLG